jgi:hypothetical protein
MNYGKLSLTWRYYTENQLQLDQMWLLPMTTNLSSDNVAITLIIK